MLDIIARFFLTFSHETMVVPIVIIGYTIYDRKKWGTAVYIMLLTMILSQFLKNIWQIPLPEHLESKGYAFPSGHMQFTTAFYGWVALECRSKIVSIICACIIIGVGFGLIHFEYHQMSDILGAIGFATLTIAIYHYVLTRFYVGCEERIGGIIGALGLILMYFTPSSFSLWLAEGTMCGFFVGWRFFKNTQMPRKLLHKILFLIISVCGVIIIKTTAMQIDSISAIIVFITYAIVGAWIAASPLVSSKLLSLISNKSK